MMIPGDGNLRNVVISWFLKLFRRMIELRVWSWGMSGFEIVGITLAFISTMEHMFDRHELCELEVVDLALVL